jgi:subtilisin family serine protease
MASRPTRRRSALAATAAALVATSFSAATASAAPASATVTRSVVASTPVPVPTPDGLLMSYLLNARQANPGSTRLVERAVRDAGGVVVQSWPQIGVVVAHADRAAFRADVVRQDRGHAVESVGATRTVAVSEGTPGRAGTATPHHGPKGAKVRSGGTDATEAATPAADPREAEQWDMSLIKADRAHATTDGSRSVVVGVLDSGIDATHPDLAANIDARDSVSCVDAGRPDTSHTSWLPTTSDHGTHVAGTIAAARNGVGIVGVAPDVRVASVKVVNDDGFIYPEYAVCGFVWAATHHMDVTNNSYYVDPYEFWCDDQPDQAAAMEAVRRAVSWSQTQGVVSAAAAGNSAYDLAHKTTDAGSPDDASKPVPRTVNNGCKDIPTELPGVVTVSSIDPQSALSSFSNYGEGVIDVAAPGSRILSTIPGGRYGLKSGTSMASPHVAGVLALMKSASPTATPAQLVARLRDQADDHACPADSTTCTGTTGDNAFYGEGIVDALDAVTPLTRSTR